MVGSAGAAVRMSLIIAHAATGTSLLSHSLPCSCSQRPPVLLVSRCLLACGTVEAESQSSLVRWRRRRDERRERRRERALAKGLEQTTDGR